MRSADAKRIDELLTRLRCAAANGVPSLLQTAVSWCIADLERIASANTAPSDADAVCAQAETLLEWIARSEDADGIPTEVVGEATQRHLDRARRLVRQARHRFGAANDDDGHAGDSGGA